LVQDICSSETLVHGGFVAGVVTVALGTVSSYTLVHVWSSETLVQAGFVAGVVTVAPESVSSYIQVYVWSSETLVQVGFVAGVVTVALESVSSYILAHVWSSETLVQAGFVAGVVTVALESVFLYTLLSGIIITFLPFSLSNKAIHPILQSTWNLPPYTFAMSALSKQNKLCCNGSASRELSGC